MRERYALGMQAERWIAHCVGLCFAKLLIGQISLLALDWPAEVPQVNANLVGAPRGWPGFDERCAIGKTVQHAKFRVTGCAIVFDRAAAEVGRATAD